MKIRPLPSIYYGDLNRGPLKDRKRIDLVAVNNLLPIIEVSRRILSPKSKEPSDKRK